jgi:hypothetical protein
MSNLKNLIVLSCIGFLVVSCQKTIEKDTEYPVIDMGGTDHEPANCDTVFRGESFIFSAHFTDNEELGSYTIDIHENFDHHNHSADIDQCTLGPVKNPVNPFLYIQSFSIPDGSIAYTAMQEIAVPPGVDEGDYHFMVRVTDKAGWQSFRALSIKIADKEEEN